MIKLNHKNEHVIAFVKDLIADALKNTYLKDFELEERKHDLLVKGTHKGYKITYSRDNETLEVEVLEVWQLDNCENPIFIV